MCKDLPNELFYPPLIDKVLADNRYYVLGKLACEVCPVRSQCGRDGAEEEFGLWGGLTPRERFGKEVKVPSRVLPKERLHLLKSMGSKPNVIELHNRIKPLLEKRPKV